MECKFILDLRTKWAQQKLACVGLDSQLEKLPTAAFNASPVPSEMQTEFNLQIVEATGSELCAYKPNISFYSGHRFNSRRAIIETCNLVHAKFPGVSVILDSKRGDIDNSNNGYVREAFDEFGADAVTVNPYMGGASLKPFFEHKMKGIIVLCRTSNPAAAEFQDAPLYFKDEVMVREHLPKALQDESFVDLGWRHKDVDGLLIPQYQWVALRFAHVWNENGNCALVVGATVPEQLAQVRRLVGDDMPILAPGIGSQQGDLDATLAAGLTKDGGGLIVNASRSVIFASNGKDYATAARAEVDKLNTQIRAHLNAR